MKRKIKNRITCILLTCILSLTLVAPQTTYATAFAAATEPTQIAHNAVNNAGWLWDAQAWMQDRLTDLDKYMELIENNVLTRSIRGFNELMTAIQGDISDVLGTVDTLMGAPTDILGQLRSIPSSLGSIFGMFQGMGLGNLFDDIKGTFGLVGNIQSQFGGSGGNIMGSAFGMGRTFASPFELSNQLSGARSSLSAQFLNDSEARDKMYKGWNRQTKKDLYGKDSVQIQATTADIAAKIVANQDRDQEFATMDRLQQQADRMVISEREKARTNRMFSDAHYGLINQIW